MSASKIDWEAAYAYWAALEPRDRTYAAVARRFGVTDTAVRKGAARHGWEERLAEIDRKVRQFTDERLERSRADRIEASMRAINLYRAKFEIALQENSVRLDAAGLAALIKLEAELDSETDTMVSIREVQRTLDEFFNLALSMIPSERHDEFLDGAKALIAIRHAADDAPPGDVAELEAGTIDEMPVDEDGTL